MSDWLSTADVLNQQRRPLDADEALAVEDVLDAAAAWAAGDLPWWEAAKIAPVRCHDRHGREVFSSGYTRYLAMMTADPADERRTDLRRLIHRLVDASGVTVTQHGILEQDDLLKHNITIRIRSEAA